MVNWRGRGLLVVHTKEGNPSSVSANARFRQGDLEILRCGMGYTFTFLFIFVYLFFFLLPLQDSSPRARNKLTDGDTVTNDEREDQPPGTNRMLLVIKERMRVGLWRRHIGSGMILEGSVPMAESQGRIRTDISIDLKKRCITRRSWSIPQRQRGPRKEMTCCCFMWNRANLGWSQCVKMNYDHQQPAGIHQ